MNFTYFHVVCITFGHYVEIKRNSQTDIRRRKRHEIKTTMSAYHTENRIAQYMNNIHAKWNAKEND